VDIVLSQPEPVGLTLALRARQQGWLDPADLESAIRARGQAHGIGRLRALRPVFASNAHAVSEWLLVGILEPIEGLSFRLNVPATLRSGEHVVLDCIIDGVPLLIEVDGFAYHGKERFVSDRRRQNALVAEGWTVLRFTWDDLVNRPHEVAQIIREAVARLRTA
jgi:very-short-patch-repair endonuclease